MVASEASEVSIVVPPLEGAGGGGEGEIEVGEREGLKLVIGGVANLSQTCIQQW